MNLLDLAPARGAVLVLAIVMGSWLVMPAAQPEHRRVVVTETETTVLDVVDFEPGTATLRPTSRATLDAVVAALEGNPSIELVEVQSHTSGIGAHDASLTLSERRATVVRAYLVAAGIASARLVAQGYGDTQPIDPAAPAKNERVSFLILKRADTTVAR